MNREGAKIVGKIAELAVNISTKKLTIAAFAALMLMMGPAAHAAPIQGTVVEVNEVDKDVAKSVRIYGDGYLIGSGFFIEGGYVIGCEHSFKVYKPYTISVEDGLGNKYPAELVAKDAHKDLALIKTDAVDHDYFELADYENLSEVKLIGNPSHSGIYFNVSKGKIVTLSRFVRLGWPDNEILSEAYRTIVAAYSAPGYSGGPAIQADGKIIGVTIGSYDDSSGAILVQLQDLKAFVAEHLPKEDKGYVAGEVVEVR